MFMLAGPPPRLASSTPKPSEIAAISIHSVGPPARRLSGCTTSAPFLQQKIHEGVFVVFVLSRGDPHIQLGREFRIPLVVPGRQRLFVPETAHLLIGAPSAHRFDAIVHRRPSCAPPRFAPRHLRARGGPLLL